MKWFSSLTASIWYRRCEFGVGGRRRNWIFCLDECNETTSSIRPYAVSCYFLISLALTSWIGDKNYNFPSQSPPKRQFIFHKCSLTSYLTAKMCVNLLFSIVLKLFSLLSSSWKTAKSHSQSIIDGGKVWIKLLRLDGVARSSWFDSKIKFQFLRTSLEDFARSAATIIVAPCFPPNADLRASHANRSAIGEGKRLKTNFYSSGLLHEKNFCWLANCFSPKEGDRPRRKFWHLFMIMNLCSIDNKELKRESKSRRRHERGGESRIHFPGTKPQIMMMLMLHWSSFFHE